jgi:hypothetical protein
VPSSPASTLLVFSTFAIDPAHDPDMAANYLSLETLLGIDIVDAIRMCFVFAACTVRNSLGSSGNLSAF